MPCAKISIFLTFSSIYLPGSIKQLLIGKEFEALFHEPWHLADKLHYSNMAYVSLPCEFEEWWDYKKILIMLSHLRSVQDLNLLISSHTRPEDGPSPTSRSLAALKGLVAFLSEFCTPDEQKRFVSSTLPFIARSAVKLEDRVPMSGIPTLEQQESKWTICL